MDDAEIVVESSLRNEEIKDRYAMPHAVMMGKIALQLQRAFEDVRRSGNDLVALVKILALLIIVSRRFGRVELFEFTNRADEQRHGKFCQLPVHDRIACPHCGAL